jgi:hypothetical protein
MKKERVLILGIGQSNFLDALYGDIKKRCDSFDLTTSDYAVFHDKSNQEPNSIYNKIVHLKEEKKRVSKSKWLFCLMQFMNTSLFWEVLFFEMSQKSRFSLIKDKISSLVRTKYVVDHFITNQDYDWLHVHFCTPENIEWFYFIPENQKAIASFWGSDLFRLTGASNVFYISKALKKVKLITVQTIEMREVLCAKYGRHLFEKIKNLRFTIDTRIFQAINSYKFDDEALLEFKEKLKLPLDKTIVALGHNGFEENNQLKMIESLHKLPKEIKDKIIFTIHLGYGVNEHFRIRLKEIIAKDKESNYCVIDYLLEDHEIAKLRIITNILIQAPISDALSAAMTEVLYAGNQVIAGAWLPYGILRRNGVKFEELESFSDLPNQLVQSLDKIHLDSTPNKLAIESFLFPNTTTKEWISLFKDN